MTAAAHGLPRRGVADAGQWRVEVDVNSASGHYLWDDPSWGPGAGLGGTAIFGKQSQSGTFGGSGPQWAARWWWLDFGPTGGLWDLTMWHTVAYDAGIYSVRVDDVEVGRIDEYNASVIANTVDTITSIVIGGGLHKLSLVMVAKNASSSDYFASVQHICLARTGSRRQDRAVMGLPTGAPVTNRVVQLAPWFASGNTSWDTLGVTGSAVSNAYIASANASGTARWWDLNLGAGTWSADLYHSVDQTCGIITLTVDGVPAGTIDTYNGSTDFNRVGSIAFSVPSTGRHRVALAVSTRNPSATGWNALVSGVSLRQLGTARDGARTLWPHLVDLTTYANSGNTNWSTLFPDTSEVYNGDVYSTGAQNAAMWWYAGLEAGTWDVSLLYRRGTNMGIYSVRVDDVEVGTVDGYGSAAVNQRATVSGARVGITGKHKVSLVMATKNGSSSNYFGEAQAVQLRRTA